MKAAIIFIQDKEDYFLVHQRSKKKFLETEKYGIGAGGKVQVGETFLQAAKRELFKETGIDAQPAFLFSLR